MQSGMLEKLVIWAHTEPDYSDKPPPERRFELFINPHELTIGYEVEYDRTQGIGTTNSPMRFKQGKPGDLSLSIFLDGTGANGERIDVQAQIDKFQEVTGYNGQLHRTNYLKVVWGSLAVKRCVLKSASITYKLFRPNGVPLRAVINASFTDNSDDRTRVAIVQDKSADLVHVRQVVAGDTLPGLCTQIYGSPHFYIQVARANRIPLFRQLVPGTRLIFPPVEK